MASKRSADNSGDAPPSKKSFALSEPINIGPVSTEEELDSAVLKIQNKKLWARLEEKNAAEEEMNNRYTKLERARENDRSIISYMNQAWNQMDEDVELMLKRFQAEDQSYRIGETTVAFLEKLSNRTTKGVKEEMEKRKQNSIKVVKKLTLLIDRVIQRKDDMTKALHNFKESSRTSSTSSQDEEENDGTFDISSVELAIRQENASLKAENKNLHDLQTSLHDKYASMSSEFTDLKDKLASSQKECSELTTKQQDMEYDLQKATKQFEKLIKKLNETQSTAAPSTSQPTALQSSSSSTAGKIGVTPAQDNEQCNELAKSRLIELEKLQKNHQKLVEEHQKLQQQLQNIPEETIVNSPKYKMLQIQFNMLFADAQIIRKSCEDARKIIINSRSQHLQQLDLLEVENEKMKKAIRAEFSSMEKQLTDTRKELELLRIEYNHNMRANEQVAPMAKEMRHLINNLQNKNQQLKNDVQRSKQKITDLQKKNEELERNKPSKVEESTEDYIDRIEAPPVSSPSSDASQSDNEASDCGDLKVLRTKLKSAREKRKDMKLLLDMYKNVSKETRDKAELLKNEKMLKEKLETVKYKLQVVTEDTVKQARRFAIHDHEKECRRLHNQIEELHKFVSNTKQEEEALMSEMEFTGQAFDEMKEQNIRLMQQLREKDDTNLKLMSERIKSNQIQKLLREEKELLSERLKTSANRMTAHEEVTKRLEEREKVLQTAVTNFEKEITLRNQAAECHKRKAMDLGEKLQETSLKLDHTNKLLEESKGCVVEKTNQLEEELFKNNRVQEENEKFKKKLKRMEYMGASDEILVEEVKMYKSKLTCPCCNTNRKDAILTKCFHVFCFECLKTRYDTRQRKCPKCNATFGNNDFHKIYM